MELENWKNQIISEEYNKIINFIECVKNCQKIENKFLFIVGNVLKGIKLVIDIENEIGVDDCDYIKYSNLEDIFVANEFILQPNNTDIKCLTIELNDEDHFINTFGIIKEICSKQNNLNFIIISKNTFIENSMLARSIIVNI
jgi:hypothetical protein